MPSEMSQKAEKAPKPEKSPKTGTSQKAAMSRSTLLITAGLSAAVLVVGVVLGWLLYTTNSIQNSENTRLEAAAVAATRVQQMFGYDHATIRDEMARALDGTTGDFHREFEEEINNNVIPRAEEQEATVTVTVIHQATIESSKDSASVLVFLNQEVKSNAGPKSTYTPSRVLVELERENGVWKVSGLQRV